jgi:NAD(P)-dependent dehydrogenase (short-subunit alcohol dehydrogenase family)
MMSKALVTGGAKRVGRAICLWLAKRGWDIVLHYNTSQLEAHALKEELEERHSVKVTLIQCDLQHDVQSLVDVIDDDVGLLVNNASYFHNDYALDLHNPDKHFAVNLFAPMILTQAMARHLKARYESGQHIVGNVVNILDYAVHLDGHEKFTSYMLSKKSLWEYTKLAALQLAPFMKVNAIAPFQVLHNPRQSYGDYQNAIDSMPLKFQNGVDVLLEALKFLIEQPGITGQMITIDGGRHLVTAPYL